MRKEDIIREVQTMIPRGGYQIAKSIVNLAEQPDGVCKMIGPSGARARRNGHRKIWHVNEARRLVEQAKARIGAADEGES